MSAEATFEKDESPKVDANDYSRFDKVDDSDDESPISPTSENTETPVLPIADAIAAANECKETGNKQFKEGNYDLSSISYQNGISLLNSYKPSTFAAISAEQEIEVRNLLVSLHGNASMVYIKEMSWTKAIQSSTEVTNLDLSNVKAWYRLGLAKGKTGNYEEAKFDLMKALEFDPTNAAAKKELADVTRIQKELQKKEKAAFGNLFSKGSMYDDREKERLDKLRREELEKERLQDEWCKSKLERREKGLSEQTFDEWKKEKDDAAAEEKKKRNNKSSSSSPTSPASSSSMEKKVKSPRTKTATDAARKSSTTEGSDDDDLYDEEDAKILAQTKSKGYCYFRKEQSSETKALIGDITPKAMSVSEPSTPVPATEDVVGGDNNTTTSGGGVSASSWNAAGTWEERDLSALAKERLKALFLEAETVVPPVDLNDPAALTETMESMKAGLSMMSGGADGGEMGNNENSLKGMEQLTAGMSSLRAHVNKNKTVEGEAQIVLARGKKMLLFDFNVELEFEVIVEASSLPGLGSMMNNDNGSPKKPQKFKGTLSFPELTAGVEQDGVVKFTKPVPPAYAKRAQQAAAALKLTVLEKVRAFENEFKSL